MTGPSLKGPRLSPPEAWEPMLRLARRATRPLETFLRIEASSGILLLVAAGVALFFANSPWAGAYARLWHTELGLRIGGFEFVRSLEWVVNDVLMAIFFFVVGMEIRREIHHGELSEWRRALLPGAAALGGMVVPALLYLSIAGAAPTRAGWGIPMATDIAFALGVLALLGSRVPPALRVLLLALAVIDDLGAIVVIAIFYSSGIALSGLVMACGGVVAILLLQAFGVRQPIGYFAPALVVWAGIYMAGIHPTIAGVLVGLLTPVRAWLGTDGLAAQLREYVDAWTGEGSKAALSSGHEISEVLRGIDAARREAVSPAVYMIERLHPWVAYAIMPVFALANAGVRIDALAFGPVELGVSCAVALGLVAGKPLGVVLASEAVLRTGLARLPTGLGMKHVVLLGVVAGVGFTMSLFVAQLAFDDARLLSAAKLGVLGASALAIVLGVGLGQLTLTRSGHVGAARCADEAEGSTEK